MQDAYKTIRIANEILTLADERGVDADFLIQIGDQWVNGECEDDSVEAFPAIVNIMMDLDTRYDNTELMHAFELLINVGNQNKL